MKRFCLTCVFVSFMIFLSHPLFAGTCALCRQSLAMGGGDGLIKGFYFSILLIVGMPFLLLGATLWMRRQGLKTKLKKEMKHAGTLQN